MRGSHHSSPASALLPAETQEERTPDGAASASAEQDPHRFPATGPWPGRHAGETRPHGTRPWRAVWHENGERQQCEAASAEKLAAPVIDAIICQDIKTEHLQKVVNAAPTPGAGGRIQGMRPAVMMPKSCCLIYNKFGIRHHCMGGFDVENDGRP